MAANMDEYTDIIESCMLYLGFKCVRCGSKENLEFDHIDPTLKSFTITSHWSYAWATLVKELDKCQLLCNSCHKQKTYYEINGELKLEEHGTVKQYRRGCKCSACRKANASYSQKFKKRRWVK